MKYRIIGPHRVASVLPGKTVDLSGLTSEQVSALVESGHVIPDDDKPRQTRVDPADKRKE